MTKTDPGAAAPPITPEMKVGDVLDAYPALEATLIGLAPEFAKLRNPILRRTVAKVATLHQAARIGGLDVRELVRALRTAAGQPVEDAIAGPPLVSESEVNRIPADAVAATPAWLIERHLEPPIDADALLASGTHPLGIVRQRLAGLPPGRVLSLVSSFRPVPLIDALRQEGYAVHVVEDPPGTFTTHFCRN
jgi:Domain of unknown function (DUF1858)/Uncharacterized conserved protein (DUF2249)